MILEKDMYKPIEEFLNIKKYKVYGEVKSIDIIGVKKKDVVIVEMKKNLNIKVLTQAFNRKKYTSKVYIAILRPKKDTKQMRDAIGILERLGIGLLYVNILESISQVQEKLKPNLDDTQEFDEIAFAKLMKELEGRSGSYNLGGLVKEKVVTAYREQAIFIGCGLKRFGPKNSKFLMNLGTNEKTYSIMYTNHYGWFDKVGKGIFTINDKGIEGMKKYPRVLKYYEDKIISMDELNKD